MLEGSTHREGQSKNQRVRAGQRREGGGGRGETEVRGKAAIKHTGYVRLGIELLLSNKFIYPQCHLFINVIN